MLKVFFGLCLLSFIFICKGQKLVQCDVLIIGGGVGGTAAAIQASRNGVKVVLVEPTPWLGGMLSAAGVSATDGNHKLPSGLWAEFREQIYKVYGGAKVVETGWVSNTHFEPKVADSILKAMVANEKNITVYYGFRLSNEKIKKLKNERIGELSFINNQLSIINFQFSIVIDATELGDVMALLKVPLDVGTNVVEANKEGITAFKKNGIIQDLTYTAIVKDYGVTQIAVMPKNYTAKEFDGCCKEFCSDTTKRKKLVTAQQMLDYAKLPKKKYLLNWPNKGNDTYINIIGKNEKDGNKALEEAKETTLRYLYFLQTELGFKNLGLALDEFPTFDKLPLIPYHRESRRVKGMVRFVVNDIQQPYRNNLYKTGIAVGDYPIDHHHKKYADTNLHEIKFPAVPSYTIPLGALIPKNVDGVIVCEKGISVSNVVNGTTRLQPVVMLTGQAAGTLAALCVQQKIQPRQINIREVQQKLLDAKAYLMPYIDVPPTHPHWESIQKVGATGIVKGTGVPYKWANQTWFYPDSLMVKTKSYLKDFGVAYLGPPENIKIGLEWETVISLLTKNIKYKKVLTKEIWEELGLTNYDPNRYFTRAEFAVVLDKVLQLFEKQEIDFLGNTIFK
jgi:hypothetical protein